MAWGNGSAGGESVFSLQCSGLTPSLPSKINSWSFLQGSRMGFSITLPLRRVMTDWTWSRCWLWDFSMVEMETYLLLKNESRCEFCKSIFKIYHGLSKLSVDCLFLFNECMQCVLKISSRMGSIRRCISMRILKIMVCLKWWLWSLFVIVITLPTKIWVIPPIRVVCLRVWVMIGSLETV
jgi:hypothetical protein